MSVHERSSVSVVSLALEASSSSRSLTDQFEIVKLPIFWAFAMANVCIGAGHITSSLFIPKVAHGRLGVETRLSGLLMTVVGGTGIVSRLLVGWMADKESVEPLYLYALGPLGSIVCCALYPFVPAYWAMALTVAAHAFFMALYSSPFTVCCLEVFGLDKLNFGTGMMLFFIGVGAIVCPPVIGYLFDLFGQDFVKTMACVGLAYGGAFIWMIVTIKLQKKK